MVSEKRKMNQLSHIHFETENSRDLFCEREKN
jgi:hypothetical protein